MAERVDIKVSYGMLEEIPGELAQYVDVPATLLFAPARRLPVETKPVVGRKRYETWTENGERMGEWRWVCAGTREWERASV